MWIIHLLGIFSVAAVAPSIPYMCFGVTPMGPCSFREGRSLIPLIPLSATTTS